MNKELEKIIVKSFFNKRIQQRVLFELFSPKKRRDALSRLNHDYLFTLREEYMIRIPNSNLDRQEIERLLIKHGAGDICYVMSLNDSIDGKEMDLKTAIDRVFGYGLSSIISCIDGKLAYFQAEQECGAPPRFILKKN
ncbi:hypothetical protein BIV60_12170 [Bacillus sp. MUM 116]|uniref:hypothetical protein n=1 Tax=Bacillus sp. MUM 116 TaxID=1678002 RepID=UPI0008F5E831|nr:hypothetical protein [Bacillus sp. MUM 116]OIK14255.1 hypothetical protein BIV60_12170 [Bacillus sp. MUM 116]